MRAGFVTCVELGFSCIREIYEIGGSLDCVITLHDHLASRKAGRVYVDEFCSENGIELFKLRHINDADALEFVRSRDLDWLFIIGWSQIAKPELLSTPRRGVAGMHPTLLPIGRGRASVPWAIIKGLTQTGVTLFQLDEGVDTGPIMGQVVIPVSADETAATLYPKVVAAHRTLIRQAWPALASGSLVPVPQDDAAATFWEGRTPEDGRITTAMTLSAVDALVRATTRPYPGAFLDIDGKRLRIWSGRKAAATGGVNGDGPRLALADGVYWVDDHDWESLG